MSNNELVAVKDRSLAIATDVEGLVGMSLEDLQELDFSCIPTIVNDGDTFKVKGTDDWEVNSKVGFNAVILSAKPYHYYRCTDESHPISGFYTYDKETLRSGEPIQDTLEQWEADDVKWAIKDYIEVHLVVVDDGPEFNSLAILNISPTSVKRFKSYVNIELKRKYKTDPWNVVTHFSLSEPLKSSNNKSFRTTEASFNGFVTQDLKDAIAE